MTSSDRWLSHNSFRLRNLTEDSPQEGLDGTFRRMAQALASYETPITFQVQLLDGEKYLSMHVSLRTKRLLNAKIAVALQPATAKYVSERGDGVGKCCINA